MPYGLLLVKPGRGLETAGKKLAKHLPYVIAPALSLEDRELHDGKVTPAQIMIWPVLGQETVNGKDLELVMLAHDFPERAANAEERKEEIRSGIREFLSGYKQDVTVGICLVLALMAYGEL